MEDKDWVELEAARELQEVLPRLDEARMRMQVVTGDTEMLRAATRLRAMEARYSRALGAVRTVVE